MLAEGYRGRGDGLREKYLPLAVKPTPEDHRCIEERHLDHKVTGMYGVEGMRCKHGMPRAFIQFPVAGRISSGMIRLTCPHLVKAIDEWEAVGAIESFNTELEQSEELRINFQETNEAHRALRNDAVTDVERQAIAKKLGDVGARNLLDSGLIGISQGRVNDVKCLHAHTADQLLRGNNVIGELALKKLHERGVDPAGCDACQQQCDLSIDRKDAQWWYTPAKNKQRLRQRKQRRKVFKEQIRGKKALEQQRTQYVCEQARKDQQQHP